MRFACLLLLILAGAVEAQVETPGEWLVIGPLDRRGRQPFNPDAIFRRYLLSRDAPPPREGEKLRGSGREDVWRSLKPDEKGRFAGRIAYAYATVSSDVERVVIARVPGGASLFVNGDGFVADVYGMRHSGVPILLRAGTNHLFVRGVRGSFRLLLDEVPEGLVLAERDATLPDAVSGEPFSTRAAIVVLNASRSAVGEVVLAVGADRRLRWLERDAVGLPPLGLRKLHLGVRGNAPRDAEAVELPVTVPGRARRTYRMRVRAAGAPRRRTFVSAIDGSLQQYSVLPPDGRAAETGLVLTLHGASVDAFNQARSYSPKDDLWIVAPTNRRPFGFDWQDWGRTDAYEVLAHALAWTGADPDRVYLTGHSMGGHGTWHLAANDPDGFAAIAPSAAWCSFDTYVGRPQGGRAKLWRGADLASITEGLIENLAQQPIFILHGTADDNVPVREAEVMELMLSQAGATVAAHYQEGAGHWWDGKAAQGADCVDWPGIFDFFSGRRRARDPRRIAFVSADPGIDSRHHWVELHQPQVYGEAARVQARIEGAKVVLRTRNVRRLRVAPPVPVHGLVVDGQAMRATTPAWLFRDAGGWIVAEPPATEKGPRRCGPFKRAFANRFVLVHGEADAESLARARYDAQSWWYRGNGDAPVVSDVRFLADGFAGRNVILYGNASANRAFDAVLPDGCPVRVRAGSLAIGERRWDGSGLGCLFLYPRRGETHALVGVVGHTGVEGARLGYCLLPFVSGVGYPDYVAFSAEVLEKSDDGVVAAGWFSHEWSLPR